MHQWVNAQEFPILRQQVIAKQNLSYEAALKQMGQIQQNAFTLNQKALFLVALLHRPSTLLDFEEDLAKTHRTKKNLFSLLKKLGLKIKTFSLCVPHIIHLPTSQGGYFCKSRIYFLKENFKHFCIHPLYQCSYEVMYNQTTKHWQIADGENFEAVSYVSSKSLWGIWNKKNPNKEVIEFEVFEKGLYLLSQAVQAAKPMTPFGVTYAVADILFEGKLDNIGNAHLKNICSCAFFDIWNRKCYLDNKITGMTNPQADCEDWYKYYAVT